MADTTIVNTPSRGVDTSDSAIGWIIAAIILVAVLVGGVGLVRRGTVAPAGSAAPAASVQVSGSTGGGTGGGTTGGATGQ